MAACMLTTTDNPYNPFTQWDEWYVFDTQMGYNTCGYLSRIVDTYNETDQFNQELEVEAAIDEIVDYNIYGIYKKVYEKS